MRFHDRYLKPLFFARRYYRILAGLILLFIAAFAFLPLFVLAQAATGAFFFLVLLDGLLLFRPPQAVKAARLVPPRMSNGDLHMIRVEVQSFLPFRVRLRLVDEPPDQFQIRDFSLETGLEAQGTYMFQYMLRPVQRGEYRFHHINLFLRTRLGLVVRRAVIPAEQTVKVYPAFQSLRRFDLLAFSQNLTGTGNRRIRKIGQSVEFEQIREYVPGDDIRAVNWKATARKVGPLMVNTYTDERSQQVYCLIDKGRVMKMPFMGMTLLDYAVNASVMLSRVALLRQDKAGLITFSHEPGDMVPASRRPGQFSRILDTLYAQQTQFLETDFERLFATLRSTVRQRSLIVLFTNFESFNALSRQIPYLRGIARSHLVLTVIFQNTGLDELVAAPVDDLESLYLHTIAEKFVVEKRLIARELQQHGIYTILTTPEQLTIRTVNKYLELKARQAI